MNGGMTTNREWHSSFETGQLLRKSVLEKGRSVWGLKQHTRLKSESLRFEAECVCQELACCFYGAIVLLTVRGKIKMAQYGLYAYCAFVIKRD